MTNILQYISILMELIIAVFGLMIAIKKKKCYGYGFALTFFIYVFYDLAKLIPLQIPSEAIYPMFFVATLSAMYAVFEVYRKK